jgi:glycosyltransferase involved in cell wall biosynthesis
MSDPRYSIIIPYYNRPELLLRAVRSVEGQTFQDFEVLIIDDASTTGLPAFPQNVRFIRRMINGGGAAARNDGIRAAKGRYVAFLDSDDYWLPDRLETANRFIAGSKLGPMVVFFSDVLVKKRQNAKVAYRNRLLVDTSFSDYLLCRGLVQTSTLIAPNDGVLFFDPNLRRFQDLDYLIQAEKSGYRFHKIPARDVIWDLISDKNRLSRREDAQSANYFVAKHRDFLQQETCEGFVLQNIAYWRRKGLNFPNFARSVLMSNLDWRRKASLILR